MGVRDPPESAEWSESSTSLGVNEGQQWLDHGDSLEIHVILQQENPILDSSLSDQTIVWTTNSDPLPSAAGIQGTCVDMGSKLVGICGREIK